jgi:hypothetical protein
MLLPADVQMGVDFVDKHNTRISKHRPTVPIANLQGPKRYAHLSNDVYHQGRDRPISVTHLAQRKFVVISTNPKSIRIDPRYLISIGKHSVTNDFERYIQGLLGSTPFF